jgi:deazaflavin-dependent oxidoreductase (nitroreductase family)
VHEVLAAHADDECCDLLTVGRVSGRPHEVEIWFGVIDRTVFIVSGNGPSADWYRNALAAGTASVRFGADRVVGSCRTVSDADERRRVGDLMGAKYPWDGDPSIGLTFEAWCYDVPVLAIEV